MDYYPNPFDENDLTTIKKVCEIYGCKVRDFRPLGGADVPGHACPWSVLDSYEDRRETYIKSKEIANKVYYMVWTPQFRHHIWLNTLSSDNNTITETALKEEDRKPFLDHAYLDVNIRRITFWRDSPNGLFRFLGVYELDYPTSLSAGVRIYRRITDILPALEKPKNKK